MPIIEHETFLGTRPNLVAFNSLSTSMSPEEDIVHFYKHDEKFIPVLDRPKKYLRQFSAFGAVLTPDVTISSGMARWHRISNTVRSRMVGVVFQHHGLKVIPSLRWSDSEDYDFVSAGLPTAGTIAFSNVGLMRDTWLRAEFIEGAHELTKLLNPVRVIIHGSLPKELSRKFSSTVEIIHVKPYFGVPKMDVENQANEDLGLFE